MSTKFNELISTIFDYQADNLDLWVEIFGKSFSNTWSKYDEAYKGIISSASNSLNTQENRTIRNGDISLFFRNPFFDRLELKISTEKALNQSTASISLGSYVHIESNYDSIHRTIYYPLHDSIVLDDGKKSDTARYNRGLTGWVAVSGQPLRINNERAKERLADTPLDNPLAKEACDVYGTPVWGNHVSEQPNRTSNVGFSIRYLAVPIKSIYDENITIGVLRYSCRAAESKELTHFELFFLEEVARIISSVNNLERMKINIQREKDLDEEIEHLKKTKDFQQFLKFVTQSLRSNISSLYLSSKSKNSNPVLCLFDAYGITNDVGSQRESISNYTSSTGGLTWRIFNSEENHVTVVNSVVVEGQWEGLNTRIFYERVLRSFCDFDENCLSDHATLKELLKQYVIKLIGVPICADGHIIGVLKVEFPLSFDIGYDSQDEEFLLKCSIAISEEMALIQKFLNTTWFDNSNKNDASTFVNLTNEIYRVNCQKSMKDSLFEEKSAEYYKKYKTEIKDMYKKLAENSIGDENKKKRFKIPAYTE